MYSIDSKCSSKLWKLAFTLLAMILGSAVGAQAGPQIPSLVLSDETGARTDFEIGRSLLVSASGLRPHQRVFLRLQDELGQEVKAAAATADAAGMIHDYLLWPHSGIIGCFDPCGEPSIGGDYRFKRLEEALQVLAGRTLRLTMSDFGDKPLAMAPLNLRVPVRGLALPVDVTGCPSFRFGKNEHVYAVVFNPEHAFELILEAQDKPGIDVRTGTDDGTFVAPSLGPTIVDLGPLPIGTTHHVLYLVNRRFPPTYVGILVEDHCPPE